MKLNPRAQHENTVLFDSRTVQQRNRVPTHAMLIKKSLLKIIARDANQYVTAVG